MEPSQLANDWVRALRSGEFKQVSSRLYKDGGFCCLGVLCHQADIEVHSQATHLPDSLCKLLGMDYAGTFDRENRFKDRNGNERFNLIDMNDREHLTFSEIADFIDAGFVKGIPARRDR